MIFLTIFRLICAGFLIGFGICVHADSSPEILAKLQSSVFKVSVERGSGTQQTGSAVWVAADTLVTNCHVLVWAKKIQVVGDGKRWPARLIAADQEHDLCLLFAPGVPFAAVAIGNPLQIGQAVHAAGFPGGGNFSVSWGTVRALHAYDAAKVIQTNASFDPGASGGGLFDDEGKLVGILTFRAVSGGDFHFVMPAVWVDALLARADSARFEGHLDGAFYRRGQGKQPFFLQAAHLESQQNWAGLLDVAQRWTNQQADNAESWMAIGKACVALSRKEKALNAFRQVLALDAQHSLGKDWLRALEPVEQCGGAANPCPIDSEILAFMEPVLP